jgi:hypothetical protein
MGGLGWSATHYITQGWSHHPRRIWGWLRPPLGCSLNLHSTVGGLGWSATHCRTQGWSHHPRRIWGWPRPPSKHPRGGRSHPQTSSGVATAIPCADRGWCDHPLFYNGWLATHRSSTLFLLKNYLSLKKIIIINKAGLF